MEKPFTQKVIEKCTSQAGSIAELDKYLKGRNVQG